MEAAELTLRAAAELEPALISMLERLAIAPAALVRANLLTVSAAAAGGAGALDEALGAEQAALLRDAAQRAAVTPRELELPFARLVVGERLGSGSFGVVHSATLDGERLALKRVSLAGLAPAQRDEALQMARREVRSLSQLAHALEPLASLGAVASSAASSETLPATQPTAAACSGSHHVSRARSAAAYHPPSS